MSWYLFLCKAYVTVRGYWGCQSCLWLGWRLQWFLLGAKYYNEWSHTIIFFGTKSCLSQWYPELPPRPLLFWFRLVPVGRAKGTGKAKISPSRQLGHSRRFKSESSARAEAPGGPQWLGCRGDDGESQPSSYHLFQIWAFIRKGIGELEQELGWEGLTAGRSQANTEELSELEQPCIGSLQLLN